MKSNCVLVVLLVGLPTIAGYAPASLIARPLRRRAAPPIAAVDPNVAFDALDLVLLSPVAVPVLGAAALGKASAAAKDESEAAFLKRHPPGAKADRAEPPAALASRCRRGCRRIAAAVACRTGLQVTPSRPARRS